MSLTPVAFIPPGCSSQCPRCLVGRSNFFAFASVHSIILYQTDSRVLPNVVDANPTGASIPDYRIVSLFGSSALSEIISFDYNDEFMACLTVQKPWVTVWRLLNGEHITEEKVPASLAKLFQKEGRPTALCVAGKNHLLFGTSTGRMVSLNTNAADKTPAEPHSVAVLAAMSPPPTPSSQHGKSTNNNFETPNTPLASRVQREVAGGVECVAVSPVRPDLVACGTSDGTLAFFTLNATAGLTLSASFCPFLPSSKEKEGLLTPSALSVSSMAFDCATAYQLVVGSREGGLALCDVNTHKGPVLVFDYKECVSAIAWVPGKTGTFCTVNRNSNLVHKWQVGTKTALTVVPLDASLGIRGIACLDGDRVSLGFTSGGVAVYNLLQREYEFQTEGGGTNTVLSCRVSHHDRDHVASVGMDGVIRVWNMKTVTSQYKIEVSGQTAVYGVEWSPNGKYLVAGLGSGEVVQFTCSTQRQGWRTPVFVGPVRHVLWVPSSADSASLVVCASNTDVALLLSRSGQLINRLTPPVGSIRCLDVEPTKGKTFVVGCADCKVYLFNLLSQNEKPILILSGHSDAVNDVAFHPSASQFLLSGGQDSTLRVWNLAASDSHAVSAKSRVLQGHTDSVQSVVWCSLAPYLALSGSADMTVALWDTREGRCLARVRRHAAGISSICGHLERPLVFFSASRDGAILTWSLSALSHVFLRAAFDVLESCVVSDASSLMSAEPGGVSSVGVVAGNSVQSLIKELSQTASNPVGRMGKILGFFESPQGCWDLLHLASYAKDPSSYAPDIKASIVPLAKIVDTQKAKAKQMHDKAHGKTVATVGPEYRKKRLLESANELLKVGQFEDYCNALIEAEEWDQAMAVAPIISRDYWRSVCIKAAVAMESIGDPRAVTYYIFAEESTKATQALTRLKGSVGVYDDAVAICRTCPQHDSSVSADLTKPTGPLNADEPPHRVFTDIQGTTAHTQYFQQQRIRALLRSQSPRVLAALHLANGSNDETIRTLLCAGDIALAHALVHIIPVSEQASIDAVYFSSMLHCARVGQWEVGLLCAARHSNPYHTFATLLSLFQDAQGKETANAGVPETSRSGIGSSLASSDALKKFHDQIRAKCEAMQLSLDPAVVRQKHANDGLSSQNQIAVMVLQTVDPSLAAATSGHVLQSICGFLENLLGVALGDINGADANFYLKQAFNVTGYVALPTRCSAGSETPGSPIQSILSNPSMGQSGTTPLSVFTADQRRFLSLCFLLAALMGVKIYRFPRLLNPAFSKAREYAKGNSALEGLVAKVQPVLANYSPHSTPAGCVPACNELLALGIDGKQITSSLTSLPIYGAVHTLEDGVSSISKGEALEWSLCCHFTVLGTGSRMLVV